METVPEKFSTKYRSVIVFGRARELSGMEKTAALERLIDKYSRDYKEKGDAYIASDADKTAVYEIVPERITGKRHD